MLPLKRYRTTFWGQPCWARPYLLEKIFGDGLETIWLEYMDDRPDYYVVRVPHGTLAAIDQASDDWHDRLMPDIERAIEEEAHERLNLRQFREYERLGYVYNTRTWPIPPDDPSGSSWGAYTGPLPLILRGGKPLPAHSAPAPSPLPGGEGRGEGGIHTSHPSHNSHPNQ